jgi:hypothetical protein
MKEESITIDELISFDSIKKGVCVVLKFFSFLRKFEKKKLITCFL